MTYVSTKLKRDIVIDEIITIHYFEYMKDFHFAGESHDFWEFLYVDKGSVTVRGGEHEYLLNVGDIIFHKPNEFHTIRSEGDKSPNLVAVSFYCDSPALSFFHEKSCTLNTRERNLISHMISEARQAFSTPLHIPSVEQVSLNNAAPFGTQQLILNYLEQFLIEVRRTHSGNAAEARSSHPYAVEEEMQKSERIDQIIQYMEFHISEKLVVQNFCDTFSLSRSALQDLFKKEKGCGIIDYFNRMKIERAKEIIRDEKMTFTEVAHFLSYGSLQYFSKQFKKATGMSPLEYSTSVKGITDLVKKATPRNASEAESAS